MTSTLTSPAQIRTTLDQVTTALHALHVDVRTYQSAMSAECFDRCEWACDGELPAIYGVYPAEGVSHDVCAACVIRCAEWAIEKSGGRSEHVTVEVATVAAPSPLLVLDTHDRFSDLADPRCDQHWARATFAVQTEQHERNLYCDQCVADAMRRALLSGGFTPSAVSAVDLDAYRMSVAA